MAMVGVVVGIGALTRVGSGSANVDDWHELVLSRGKLHTPDGVVSLERIGKGMFATVYRDRGDPSKVWIFVDDRAHQKQILWMLRGEAEDNPHLPSVERMGYTKDQTVYRMPFYRKLTKASAPRAWADYQAIRRCLGSLPPLDNTYDGYDRSYRAVECVKNADVVSDELVEALELLRDTAADYGSSYAMEISPRNLAVDEQGNLVLLDLMYDAELVRRIRRQQVARSRMNRGAGGWGW